MLSFFKKNIRHSGISRLQIGNVWTPGTVEALEPRVLLAGDPIISEFQALNDSTLQDSRGRFEDWIEVGNRTDGPIDLGGWYLTDDDTNLTKWKFPSVTIPANDEIVVFASGDDKTDDIAELHANFRLSGSGEYLALVRPDGITVAHDLGGPYPQQFEDQSYGVAFTRETVPLFDKATEVAAFVPTDDLLGLEWTQTEFDDSAWTSGNLGVGYEVLADATSVRDEFEAPLGEDWTIDLPEGATGTVEVSAGTLNISVAGQDAAFTDRGLAPIVHRSLPDNTGDYEIITQLSQGASDRGAAGIAVIDGDTGLPAIQVEYTTGLFFQLVTGGESQGTVASFGSASYFVRLVRDGRAKTWTGYFKLAEGDDWTQIAHAEDGINGVPIFQNAQVGLVARAPASEMNAQFSSIEINTPEEQPTYTSRTSLDIGEQLNGANSSVYMRIPFDVDGDPARFSEMDLLASFDDGFRAYLNGTEIAAENVPVIGSWDSTASSEFGAVNGRIPTRSIDVAAFTNALLPGKNILAVHGMNAAVDDPDYFFEASMTAGEIQSSVQFFIEPTPGEPNAFAAAPQPQLIGEQGVFFGSTVVELVLPEPSPELEIRYTVDGGEPMTDSELYTGPITLTESAMLQAKAFSASEEKLLSPSNPVSGTFFALAEELRDRESDIPLVILDTIGQRLPGSGSTTLASTNVVFFEVDKATGRSSIENGIVDYLGRGGVRDRGSSTAGQPKPNMAFETWGPTGTTSDDDFDVGLGDFAPESDWILHAPYNFDRALVRNQFAYATSNEVADRWAPGTRAVEVYFNRGRDGVVTEGDYAGVYVLIEKIKQGPDRVDIVDISPEDNAEPEVSGGYIWKIDRLDPSEPGFSAGSQTLNWVHPKSPRSRTASENQKATAEQEDWVQDYFNGFRDALRNDETRDLDNPDGYAKYVDVDAAIDHSWLNVFTFNVDALRLSAYLHKDRDGKIVYGPLWDCDRCMGSTDGRDINPEVWGDNFFTFLWWRDMFRDPNFWQAYVDRWSDVRRDELSNEGISSILDRLAGEVEGSSQRNIDKWRQNPRSNSAFDSDALDGTWKGEVEHLRDWLHARAEFMDSNFVGAPSVFIGADAVAANAKGRRLAAGTEISVAGPIQEVFDDTPLVSSSPETLVKYLVPTDDSLTDEWAKLEFDDSAWASGPTGVGYENSDRFVDLIRTPVTPSEVQEGATTILTRYEFEVTDLDAINEQLLVFRAKYDDGIVVYLNGTEVKRAGIRDDELAWNSRGRTRRSSDAVAFEDFDMAEFKDLLVPGKNMLAIRLVNSSASNSDIMLLPELVTRIVSVKPNPAGNVYYTTDGTDPRGRDGSPTASAIVATPGSTFKVDRNVRITARNFDDVTDRGRTSSVVGTDWSGLTVYDFAVDESPIVISEVNYHPSAPTDAELLAMPELSKSDFEFVEIFNPTSAAVDLVGVEISDGVEFDFINSASTELLAGERLLVVSNKSAFELRYGNQRPVAGEFTGSLSDSGEDIDIIDATGDVIFSVNYADNDPWPVRADGNGATLQLVDPQNTSANETSKYYSWRGSSEFGGSPGTDGKEPVGVVINEVIANTDGADALTDSIELFNPTAVEVEIGGWFLSDSTDFMKFQIPAGTVLGPGEYQVFDESDFNPDGGDTAAFALSGVGGDSVWLVIPNGETVDTFVDDVHFRETPPLISLGRLPNGIGRLAPLADLSLGTPNGDAAAPSVSITEVNYNPGQPSDAALSVAPLLSDDDLEFIEIHNAGGEAQKMTDWRLRGIVDFEFSDDATLAAGETAVIVKFNPDSPRSVGRLAGFRAHYAIDESVRILGGYDGQLNNSDGKVLLLRAIDSPADQPDITLRVQEDEVLYDDLAPWPVNADGSGNSLQRFPIAAFGNDAASWTAMAPTPGSLPTTIPGDFDGSGTVDVVDIDLLYEQLRSDSPDRSFDLTGDSNVDNADRDRLIQDILGTVFGDTNLDGILNTSDLIQAMGEYEDGIPLNSTWAEGDWDGDGDFGTRDLVLAFQSGLYSAAAIRSAFRPTQFGAARTPDAAEEVQSNDQVASFTMAPRSKERSERLLTKLTTDSFFAMDASERFRDAESSGPPESNDDGQDFGRAPWQSR